MTLLLDDLRSRIKRLVNAVPESHQTGGIVFILDLLQEAFDASAPLDHPEHFDDLLIRAAVQRTGKSGNSRRNCRIEIHLGASDRPHRRRRTVLFMIGMQNQQNIENAHRFRRNLVRIDRRIEHHVQEVCTVGQIMPRIHHRFPDALLVRHGRHRADNGNQPGRGKFDILLHGLQIHVRIKRGQRVDHRGEDMHRMSSAREMVEEMAHILMEQRVHVQQFGKLPALHLRGQSSVHEEVSDLHKGGGLDQIFNGNSPITQDAAFSIHKGDFAVTGSGVHETGIDCDISGLFSQLGDVERLFSFRSGNDGKTDLAIADLQHNKFILFHEPNSLNFRVTSQRHKEVT